MEELTRVVGSEMPLEIALTDLETNLPLNTTVGYTQTIWAKTAPKDTEPLFPAVSGVPEAGGLVVFDLPSSAWEKVPMGKTFWYVKGVLGGRCKILEKFVLIQEEQPKPEMKPFSQKNSEKDRRKRGKFERK